MAAQVNALPRIIIDLLILTLIEDMNHALPSSDSATTLPGTNMT